MHGTRPYFTYRPGFEANYVPYIYIMGIFRGYECVRGLQIKHVQRTFIRTNEISHACMHVAERLLFRENLLTVILQKFIPSKYPLYAIYIQSCIYSIQVLYCTFIFALHAYQFWEVGRYCMAAWNFIVSSLRLGV